MCALIIFSIPYPALPGYTPQPHTPNLHHFVLTCIWGNTNYLLLTQLLENGTKEMEICTFISQTQTFYPLTEPMYETEDQLGA